MRYEHPVLVVEDEPDGQELVSRLLAVAGIPVEIAADGETAWKMLKSKRYLAAIIDLALPGMDGIELLRSIRADANLANMRCMAITAYHTPELKQRALEDGFNVYFSKPLDRNLFIGALDDLLDS